MTLLLISRVASRRRWREGIGEALFRVAHNPSCRSVSVFLYDQEIDAGRQDLKRGRAAVDGLADRDFFGPGFKLVNAVMGHLAFHHLTFVYLKVGEIPSLPR